MAAYHRTRSGLWVNKGLVGYWPLSANTIQGGQALDLSGNKNNGTLVASPKIVPGPFGGNSTALSFNGSSQYIAVTGEQSPGANDFTFSCWINAPAVAQVAAVFGERLGSPSYAQWFMGVGRVQEGTPVASQQIYFFSYNSYSGGYLGSYWTTGNVVDGNWHHVATVRAATTFLIYVDGVSVPVTTDYAISTNTMPSVGGAQIGQAPGLNFLLASISGLRNTSRALSPAEIAALAANRSPTFGLVQPRRLLVNVASAAVARSQFFLGFP
jgi:hypothetical protein